MGRTTVAWTLGAMFLAGGLSGCGQKSQTETAWQEETKIEKIEFEEIDVSKATEKWWSYQYYYYPECQVYYEPYGQVYYWFDKGAWYEGQILPDQFVLRKATRKLVKLDTNKPWTQHGKVAKSHGPKTPFEGSTSIPRANVEALDTYTAVDPDMQ